MLGLRAPTFDEGFLILEIMKKLLKERKGFNFYRSYFDVFNMLQTDKDKLDYITAILERQFEGNEPELDGMSLLAYVSQKHSVDKQIEGFINQQRKKDPSIPPYQDPTQPPSYVSNDSVMTTEDPSIPPYQQEKEKEKEKEEEKEQVQEKDENELLELFWNKRK
jgi:hypothetical protein